MTARTLALLSLALACNPKDPGETATDAASTSDAATTGDATTSPTSGAATTIGSTDATTSGSSTDAATTTSATTTEPPPVCAWYLPEHQGLVFCPAPIAENAAISGTTPFGPVDLRYAEFGLFECADCPTPASFSLRLYADPPNLGEASGDFLGFEYFSGLQLATFTDPGAIGGQSVAMAQFDVTLTDVVIPTLEQTSPPLDESTPPVVSGTVKLSGDGWDVSGTFSATLCTELNWIIPCE